MQNLPNIPALLAEYETRLLKDSLFSFPTRIHQKKQELYEARKALADAQTARLEVEAMLQVMIAAEINPHTGKPAYSNAQARTAELTNRKKSSAEYQNTDQVVRDAESVVSTLQFDLERIQDEFRSYRYVIDLTARELALMASDIHSEERTMQNGNGSKVSELY